MAKYMYIEKIWPLPAEYFVFCGKFCLADSLRSFFQVWKLISFDHDFCWRMDSNHIQMKLLYVTKNCLRILPAHLVEHDRPVVERKVSPWSFSWLLRSATLLGSGLMSGVTCLMVYIGKYSSYSISFIQVITLTLLSI
jgi:hypothetical protein